ncbi:hypothetical protein JCGZ_10948 [Jatropha curcas]|uniref:Uncharacterized protein n=1 Tax=Jatropha curcas TaxID=180498 RepID=A0A067KFU9_JATCU|nr:uncharacterized protein LOC105636745 [Jatropha curcas]KDP35106.1 hypothetical protein JCGZ_10948 [Jatropha curcas]
MDPHNSKANGKVNGFRHFYSSEQLDHLTKVESLSDSYRVLADGDTGLDKQKHGSISDPEISSCESAQSTEIENNCLKHDRMSSTHCTKENADELTVLSSVVSPSRSSEPKKKNFAQGTCKVVLGSENPDDGSASSPTGIDSTHNISMKSDVSSEGRQALGKETNEPAGGRMNRCWLASEEDGLKTVMAAACSSKQLKTESSSSNSIRTNLPASSNDSCQEISVDAKSCERSKHSSIDVCTCTGLNCCMEKPAVKSSLLGMTLQISCKDGLNVTAFSPGKQDQTCDFSEIVGNVETRVCDKLVEIIGDENPVVLEKSNLQKSISPEEEDTEFAKPKHCCELNGSIAVVQKDAGDAEHEAGIYKEASGSCCSSIQEKSGETVHLSSVDSIVSKCLTESGSKIQYGNKRDRYHSVASTKGEVKKLCLEVKEPSEYRDNTKKHKANDGTHGQASSPLTTKSEDMRVINQQQANYFSGIDLNENIFANEMDYNKQSIKEEPFRAEFVSKPTPVIAKSGMPICLPKLHIQLDGSAGGWRGPAATSAFRPTPFSDSINRVKASSPQDSHNHSKSSQVTGIDLNIVAEGGDGDIELLSEKCSQPGSSVEIGSLRVGKFNIDLNYSSEIDENSRQPFPPATLSRNYSKDFDLNNSPTSLDTCSDSHLLALRDGASGDRVVTFLGNARQLESNNVGLPYQADLSPIQSFSYGQTKPFLMAAAPSIFPSIEQMQNAVSLQQRPTYASYPPPPHLPPQTFICNNAFFIDPNNRLSTNVYPRSPIPAFVSHILGSSAPSAFSGASYLMHCPDGPSSNDIALLRPSFDQSGGISSSESASWGDNRKQLFIPVNNGTENQIRALHQLALSAAPIKREPDGGWESHQLGFKQMTSWR